MDGELLSLKWNNHRTTFYHVISGLRNKESYTDVTLACDGKFYPVHKLVLSTCSEYFSDIFERTNCKNPVVILKDIQCSDLEFLLDYMYIGEVNVRQNELSSLIKAAECLRVKGLAVPDEEPKKLSSSSNRQRPEQQSPPPKRRRTEERRNTDHSPGRPPDTRRGSSSSVNSEVRDINPARDINPIRDINPARDINPSQRSDDPPPRRDQNSSSDKVVGTPVVQEIKLEKDDEDQDIYIQSNSFDGGGDGPDTEGDSATDFPEFLQSSIEKEEPMSMSDYNPSDFAGPSGLQNSGVPPWDGDSSGFTESLSGAVAAAVAAAQQPGQQQQQQQQLVSEGNAGLDATAASSASSSLPTTHSTLPATHSRSSATMPARHFFSQTGFSDTSSYGLAMGNFTSSCPHCGFVAATEEVLIQHMKRHTSGKPIQCNQCEYKTIRRSDMTKHVRTHTGERPFGCHLCDYRTNNSSNLKQHLRVHHPDHTE